MNRRKLSKRFMRCCIALIATSLLGLSASALASLEMDENIRNQGGVDWEDLFNVDEFGEATAKSTDNLPTTFKKSVFIRDFVPGRNGPDFSTFTTGSKDTLDINPGWECAKSNNVNDKTDIVNAYAAAAQEGNDVVVYFALERYSNEGTGNVGFWFLQDDNVGCDISHGSTSTFTGHHQHGDILIVSEFSKGGALASIFAYKWIVENEGEVGYLDPTPIASGSECVDGGATQTLCALSNQAPISGWGADTGVPWLTETKQPGNTPSNNLDTSEFFEGKINLSQLKLLGCFSKYMGVTRSSTTLNSTMFDFALGDFQLCGIAVNKMCTGGTLVNGDTEISYDVSGSVVNTGIAPVYNVTVTDDPAFATGPNLPSTTLIDTLAYSGTTIVPLIGNGSDDTVTVTANTSPDGSGLKLTAKATATCPTVTVSPSLSIVKDCEAAIDASSGQLVAKVNFKGSVCNTGDSRLDNVSVTDYYEGKSQDVTLSSTTLVRPEDRNNPMATEGACATYEGTYTPSMAASTKPGEIEFKDSVEAKAEDIFGKPVGPATDSATCPLCPKCDNC